MMAHAALESTLNSAPSHWERRRFRFATRLRTERNRLSDQPLLSVSAAQGVRERDEGGLGRQAPAEETIPMYWVVRPGDIVVNPMWVIEGGVAASAMTGAVSPAYRVYVPAPGVESRYLHHLLRSRPYIEQYKQHVRGVTTFDRAVSKEDFHELPVLLPPLAEQRRIAEFLDAETGRMDALVARYTRLKSLMAERRQRAVDAEIESEVRHLPLRYVIRFREGPGIMAEDFEPTGVPLLRVSGLRDGHVTLHGCNFLDPKKVATKWKKFGVKLGDRLLSGSATMGAVSVVDDPSVVGSIPYTGLIILRPARPDVDMGYVEAFLSSSLFMRQIDVLKAGAAMQHFGPMHLSQIKSPLPPPERQRAVVSRVSIAVKREQAMRSLIDRQVSRIAERRQALITAAVTGQIDVSTASGRGIED
ncbi:hypothetical protein ACLQ3H_23900 [Micromonospora saelicesensis]|uniref:hypothetical protein n=1 Tax=Micromonospora saelicesensis TaxID=285676 RepID=UPI003CE9A7B0